MSYEGKFEIKAKIPKGDSAKEMKIQYTLPMDSASKEQADAIAASSLQYINAMLKRSGSEHYLVAHKKDTQ